MKVEKNSPLAQMLLKLAAEHDPKLREAIRNGEVEGVNIIAVGGAPDGEVKELLESLAKDEDDCKNCENRDGCEDAKAATPCDDAEDADDGISIIDEIRSIADDPDIPESIAAPARVVLAVAELMDILNPVPRMVSPKRMRPYTARRAAMLADVSAAIRRAQTAIRRAQTDILDAMHRYPEFAEITDAYFDDSEEENTTETE